MINLDNITNNNNNNHNEKWPYIPDHPYRILIIGGSGSGKTNTLLNLINEQKDIDKIYLYAKDLSEKKYEYLIRNRENVGIKHLNDSKAFIECLNTVNDVYENIDNYNPNRKRKILIVFDDMIADIMTNKKFQSIIKELFIRCRKINISLVFITQSYFSVPEEGLFKRLENIKDKNEELINRFGTTNKASENKTDNQRKKLIYDVNHSFAKLKNIDDIKKLSLDSLFHLMKQHHQ